MNKTLIKTLVAASVICGSAFAFTSCGKTEAKVENFTGYRMDSEAGFDELYFPVTQELILCGSNYTYVETTLMVHSLAKNIVATHMYTFSGTFTVSAENAEEGTKTVVLSTPTYGIDSGTGTTLADDAELMDKFVINTTVELNTVNYTATFTLAA